jgi:hypothetical protein
MRFLKIIKAILTLIAFILTLGPFVFPDDQEKETTTIAQQTDQQKKELSEDPAYRAWKAKYDENKQKFDSSKKTIHTGMITTGAGLAIEIISAVFLVSSSVNEYGVVERSGTVGYFIGALASTAGAGIWIYGAVKRHSAKEEMDVLMDEGRIKGYIKASIIPSIDFQAHRYAVTFTITF